MPDKSDQNPDDLSEAAGTEPVKPMLPSWQRDLLKGLLWALLIVVSLLFYSGGASHFIYVDF